MTSPKPAKNPIPTDAAAPTDRPAPAANDRAPEAAGGFAFPTECRIRRGADFQRAYRRRCVTSNELIVVHGCENGLTHPRLGLSVSRKVGGATVRNRWKRLLREAFRLSRRELPPGVDLVIVPRQGVVPELAPLLAALPELARQVARKLQRGRR